jgi:pimeloyl-ACP methyl ester carboxylesterase
MPIANRPDPLTRRTLLGATGGLAATAATASQPALAPWTGEIFVARAGGRIHSVEMGPQGAATGEPLVLLHKLGGWVADWRAMAPYLAARRRVIAIDLPGHGESSMLGPPPYVQTVEETAAMVMATLDELGLDRVTLVGNSLGGITSVVMAAHWPDRVRKLVLISVSLNSAMSRSELQKADSQVRDQFGPNWEPLPRTAASLHRFGAMDPAVLAENNSSRAKAGVWVRPSERGVALSAIPSYLPKIEAPTLLIYGDQGIYTQWETVGRANLKSVTVDHVAGGGSFVHQAKPLETATIIDRFLAG